MDIERLWQWLLADAYWYCFAFFLSSILLEELIAPQRRWRNRDDRIVYGQSEDSPTNIRNGRSAPPQPRHSHPLMDFLTTSPHWQRCRALFFSTHSHRHPTPSHTTGRSLRHREKP